MYIVYYLFKCFCYLLYIGILILKYYLYVKLIFVMKD